MTKEEQQRLHRLGPMELVGMIIDLEKSLAKAKRLKGKPRPSPAVIRVLTSCFSSAESGGFEGDTDDVTRQGAEATRRWLDAWRGA